MVVGFAYACFTVLAPWQLGKNTSTEERNDRIAESLSQDPVPVGDLLDGDEPAQDDEWRRVTATGSYLPNSDVLVRLRSVDAQPAYEVLTPPFVLDSGRRCWSIAGSSVQFGAPRFRRSTRPRPGR